MPGRSRREGERKIEMSRVGTNRRLRSKNAAKLRTPLTSPYHPLVADSSPTAAAVPSSKGKKKAGGARLWMSIKRNGESMVKEYEKSEIIKWAAIPSRDLRILGPVFSHSSNILGREKAMLVNLDFIKVIVTAEEVLLLDPLGQEVLPIVHQLRQLQPDKGLESELPFEFQVLEIALEVLCRYLDASVEELERDAYPILDDLARNVSTKNLELVRSLKSKVTRLHARVQKVRDEIEHLLDDNEDMAQLYLTRKSIQNEQYEAVLGSSVSDSIITARHNLPRLSYKRSASQINGNFPEDDVEDLEMLLEAYFMQLDSTRNKILSVREYIDDTEDYVNIQLSNQRNELIQLQLILGIATFAIALDTAIAGIFGMNIPCVLYDMDGVFWPFVFGSAAFCFLFFLLILGYARWKKLIMS